jgi:hypothetical protein
MLNFCKTGTGFFFFVFVIANCEAVKPAGFGAANQSRLVYRFLSGYFVTALLAIRKNNKKTNF